MTQPKNKFTEDDNVVYPSAFFQESKLTKEYRGVTSKKDVTPEERQFIEDCLREYSGIRKRLRQEWNRVVLNVNRDEILRSGPVPSYLSVEDIVDTVDTLDQRLTNNTNSYLWEVIGSFVSVYEYETQDSYHGNNPARRTNWGRLGSAPLADRRFLPEENVKRYLGAKNIFDERLEDVALDAEKEYLKQIETRIYENPLFHYVVARFQRRNNNPRSTDLF